MTVDESLNKVPGLGKLPKPAKYAIGIAAIGALGYIVYRYAGRAMAGGSKPDEQTGTDDFSDYPGDPITRAQPVQDPGDNEPVETKTDADWAKEAVDNLRAVGYTDTAMVARVLGAWLANQDLGNEGEVTVVRTAVGLTGRPPSGDHPYRVKASNPANPTPSQPQPDPTPAAPATGGYTWKILGGQTLESIASYLRSAKGWKGTAQDIYRENSAVFEAEARKRGKSSSNAGNLIFPGTTINIRNR